MAMVGAPWARAAAMTATMSGEAPDWLIPMTSASDQIGRDPIERHDRRDPEPDRQPMPDAEHVLRIDRGMVRGPARGDDDVLRRAVAQRAGDAFDRLRLGGQEPGRGGGLLVDLVAQAHRGWSPGEDGPPRWGDSGRAGCWMRMTRLALCGRVCACVALVGSSVRAMPRLGVLQWGDRALSSDLAKPARPMLATRPDFVHPQDKVRAPRGGRRSAVGGRRSPAPPGYANDRHQAGGVPPNARNQASSPLAGTLAGAASARPTTPAHRPAGRRRYTPRSEVGPDRAFSVPPPTSRQHALAETSDERPPVRPWTTVHIRDAVRGLPTAGRVPRAFLVRLGSGLLPRPARRLGPGPGHRLRPGRHGTRRRSHPRRRRRPAGPGPLRQDRPRSLVCRGQRLPLQLHPEPRVVGQEGPPRPGADGLAQPPLRRARRPEPPGDHRLRRVRPVRRRPLADRPGASRSTDSPTRRATRSRSSSMPGARRSPRCVAR